MENFIYKSEPDKKIDKQERMNKKIIQITNMIRQLWGIRKKLLIINSIVAVIAAACLLFLIKPYYESTIVILPEFGSKSTSLGGLSDLATMAGFKLDASPTEIYQNLILSEAILGDVINAKYQTEEFSKPVNLIEYFEIEPDESLDPAKAERGQTLDAFIVLSEKRIKVSVDKLTKVLTITVRMPESELSANVANTLVESLDDYIRNKRKTFASQQRFYIEKRIAQVEDSLKITEGKLKDFRDKNRIVDQSPNLILEQARLVRNVEIQQSVYIELIKQLEIIKIDEIKDTPIINNREEAKDPVIKAGPPRAIIFLIIVFLMFAGTCGYYIYQPKLEYYLSLVKMNNKNKLQAIPEIADQGGT